MSSAIIGTYRVLRKLGEGGMGAVYLAEHTLLGRRAAIKILLPAFSANEEVVGRFFNEARSTTAIADPGIVQVFDFGYHTDGSAYLVMEFLEGETFDARLARLGRFRPSDALRLVRQSAISLAAAHARGIVHRDLKPENLFIVGDAAVTGGERPKILDFGIAKLGGDEADRHKTRTGTILGTPVFMSPEQCRGGGDLDLRSDIYSLGCVLFCILTGRPPFQSEHVGDLIVAHLREPAPPPSALVPTLPTVIDAIVLRCLAKSPGDRFQSMHELAHALGAAGEVIHEAPGYPTAGAMPSVPISSAHALTTLSTGAGQRSGALGAGRAPTRKRAAWIAGSVFVAVAAATTLLLVATEDGEVASAGREEPASASTPAAAVDAAAAVEIPAPSPAASPVASPSPSPSLSPSPSPDAGVGAADAGLQAPAAVRAPTRSSTRRKPTRGTERNERTNPGPEPGTFDRGD
jgi:serine/threonine-protein kinase